jgi:hypothetical protein
MSMEDWDEIDAALEQEHLLQVADELKRNRLRLHRTISDLRAGRRTPDQRDAVTQRSRALCYRSTLIMQRIRDRFRVH